MNDYQDCVNNKEILEIDIDSLAEESFSDVDSSVDGSDEGESDLSEEITDISLDKNDRSLFQLHDWYKRGRLIIDKILDMDLKLGTVVYPC
jgi:hypothetical protein